MRRCEGAGFSLYVQQGEAEKAKNGANWYAVFMKSNGGHFECCYDK